MVVASPRPQRRICSLFVFVALFGSAVSAQADLIGLYQFDDPANLGKDTSGHGHDATNFGLGGGTGYDPVGYQGGAASFGASSLDFLSVPINVNPSVLPQMTWGAWVMPSVGSLERGILSADDGGFDRTLGLDDRGGPTYGWSAFTGTGVLNSGITPSLTSWTFIAASYDQTAATMTFYVNDQSFTASTAFGSSLSTFAIGGNTSFSRYFSGLIDNVFIYSTALSSAEIAAIRANGFPSTTVPEPSTSVLILVGGTLVFGLHPRRHAAARRDC